MKNKNYLCQICGNQDSSTAEHPSCIFCGNETPIIISDKEIIEQKKYIRNLYDNGKSEYKTTDVCLMDGTIDSDINVFTKEKLRRKYVYNSPQFNRALFEARVKKYTANPHKPNNEFSTFDTIITLLIAGIIILLIGLGVLGIVTYITMKIFGANIGMAIIFGIFFLVCGYVLLRCIINGIWKLF